MGLREIARTVPPPTTPKGYDRRAAELKSEMLGLTLPEEFTTFCDLYGEGRLSCDDFSFFFFSPGFSSFMYDIKEAFFGLLIGMITLSGRRIDFPYSPYPRYPALFPLGGNDVGDSLYWIVSSSTEVLPTDILIVTRDLRYQAVGGSFLSLVERLIRVDEDLIFADGFEFASVPSFRFVPRETDG